MGGEYARQKRRHGVMMARRACMLAAMDCIMHKIRDPHEFENWTACGMPDIFNSVVLDDDETNMKARIRQYFGAATSMSDNEFNCVVRLFADIVRSQCFSSAFEPGAFDLKNNERGPI